MLGRTLHVKSSSRPTCIASTTSRLAVEMTEIRDTKPAIPGNLAAHPTNGLSEPIVHRERWGNTHD